ncbi:poly-gamma-glutamate system protein [Leptospira interrogans]|uniref:poly-gamma-glutamate system protein n=1 Tax=Leptospira interrogans TaxID=173 RepID=UPI0002922CD5|nr:poly-gamma-glutamate system protein [Leptospira interrogans]EKO07757.1 poly-gamma-glutamate system protein [Leptospira interrogans str. C10069]EMN61468.1 poly-gamma-glutamate system protein [Leptospira interrogans serovar Pyrogenes str. R168]ULG84985.1 poly-gamma-glutamate system protein [Leptospira interrogans]ULG88155.1 poly-gamma-glutamate system protein [Leptospira interrogans]UML74894.1 poly-gamma-glutamate system protein [Leptospira interrogans]
MNRFFKNKTWFVLLFLNIVSVGFIAILEFFPLILPVTNLKEKYEASQKTYKAFLKIKELKLSKKIQIDPKLDSYLSGLIGLEISPVTSSAGKLSAKQASIHPDFAAWFVDRFQKTGLKKGDTIAAGISGSFPALNVAFWVAADIMELKVISISSATSSQYGANDPELLWPDIENLLYKEKIIFQKSVFMSTGGISDSGIGLGKKGRELIWTSIRKNGYKYLSSDSFEDSLLKRMDVYNSHPVALYVNIGGGTVSSGTSLSKKQIPKGVVLSEVESMELPDSILKTYLGLKIPVLHVSGVEMISKESNMKYSPGKISEPGTSDLIFPKKYNRWLAGFFFVLLSSLIWILSTWISLSDHTKEDTILL